MLRPATRTRILSAGVGATALVAALALAANPSSDLNPLGPLGRAEASAPGAPAAPEAFGVPGVDLTALGYSGPDLAATTLEQLNEPLADLPTARAAEVRDRLHAATPHLTGLHQAKNLLGKAATKQDHHVNAAKVAVAEAEEARVEAEARLQEAIRAATRPAAPDVPAGDRDRSGSGLIEAGAAAALASVTADHGESREQGAGSTKGAAAPAPVDRSADEPARAQTSAAGDEPTTGAAGATGDGSKGDGGGKASGAGGQAAAKDEPKGADGSAKGSKGSKGSAKPTDAGAKGAPAAGGEEAPKGSGQPAANAAEAPKGAPTGDDAAVAGKGSTPAGDDAEGQGSEAADRTDAGIAAAQALVRQALEVERLAVEAASARAHAAEQWRQLEERRERRRTLRAAAEAAESELDRFDDHVRWLETVLSKAQAKMLSTGNWLVIEERKDDDLPIVEVRGFKVHASLEDAIRQLVDEAAAAGIDLKGKAYRPVSRQIELRRQNCGPSEYQIYEMPSSQCSPPTAKPGRSLHELGLAFDFMNGDNSITSRSDPAFRWLARHAPAYGLYNLPAEPWHWSVTSQ